MYSLPIIALIIFSLIGAIYAFLLAKRVGRALNFRTLIILYYVAINLLSGVVHLSKISGQSRGFFDATTAQPDVVASATLGNLLGLFALCVGCTLRLPAQTTGLAHPPLLSNDRRILFALLAIITPLAFYSFRVLQHYIDTVGYTRGVTIDQGMARYVFLSSWTAWVICFVALLLLSRTRTPLVAMLILAASSVGIISLASWSGGRTEGLVTLAPLLIVTAYRLRGLRRPAAIASAAVALAYITSVTAERLGPSSSTQSSLFTWLDWEIGRFSMLGFATEYVNQHGPLLGETYVATLSNLMLGILRMLGFDAPNPNLRLMLDITGVETLGRNVSYVVAGMSAELYINFGIVGIVSGFFLLGMAVGAVDTRLTTSNSLLTQFFWAFLGINLLFRTISSDASAIGYYLLYSGLPVVLAGVLSILSARHLTQNHQLPSPDAPTRYRSRAIARQTRR